MTVHRAWRPTAILYCDVCKKETILQPNISQGELERKVEEHVCGVQGKAWDEA